MLLHNAPVSPEDPKYRLQSPYRYGVGKVLEVADYPGRDDGKGNVVLLIKKGTGEMFVSVPKNLVCKSGTAGCGCGKK